MTNHPGGTEQLGGAALAQGGVRGGSFSRFQVFGRSSHIIFGNGFLVDYHFNYRMGHVQGNFDLKTMTARVGSGPFVIVSRRALMPPGHCHSYQGEGGNLPCTKPGIGSNSPRVKRWH